MVENSGVELMQVGNSAEEDEELGLVMVSREHDEITALLPELGRLHKSLREIGHTEHLGTIEDTIGYLSVRLQEMWSEYTVQLGLGKAALQGNQTPPPEEGSGINGSA